MSKTKYEQLVELMASLTLEDLIDPKTSKMLDTDVIDAKLLTLRKQYVHSPSWYAVLNDQAKKNQSNLERKQKLDEARAAWVRENLKVGDYVHVTGAKANPYRKVISLGEYGFDNLQINVKTKTELPRATTTTYGKVTHVFSSKTGTYEPVPV